MATSTRIRSSKWSVPEFIHAYHPYRSSKFDRKSGRILDFKDGHTDTIRHYRSRLDARLSKRAVLATVPSHKPGNAGTIDKVARELAARHWRSDATSCLVRHTKVNKLSRGGSRKVNVHLDSIRVENAHLIKGRRVTLLDDVTTTGNSFRACRQLLLDAGAKEVRCLALAKTTY